MMLLRGESVTYLFGEVRVQIGVDSSIRISENLEPEALNGYE